MVLNRLDAVAGCLSLEDRNLLEHELRFREFISDISTIIKTYFLLYQS